MVDPDKRTRRMPEHNGYLIPGALMHRLILSIIVAIVTIGGYMVAWGIADAGFKAKVLTEMIYIKDRVKELGKDQDEHESEKHPERFR
jgi:hypothetical protein